MPEAAGASLIIYKITIVHKKNYSNCVWEDIINGPLMRVLHTSISMLLNKYAFS